jgi:hypothetical protein
MELSKHDKLRISTGYGLISKTKEYECMFYNYDPVLDRKIYNLSELQVKNVMGNMINKYKTYDETMSLHVSYNVGNNTNYRIEILTLDSIKKYITILKNINRNDVFSNLLNVINTDKTVSLTKKIKNDEHTFNINDYGIRFRLSDEIDKIEDDEFEKLNNLSHFEGSDINYRLRNRYTFPMITNKDYKINMDITSIQTGTKLNELTYNSYSYEIEIEAYKNDDKINGLDDFYNCIEYVLKIFQQSPILISLSKREIILGNLLQLLKVKNIHKIYLRNPIALEKSNFIYNIKNSYFITDKADGQRYLLYIYLGRCYLISTTYKVIDIDVKVDEKYNNTLFDGEYIHLREHNKYIYMTFDLLFSSGIDFRFKNLIIRLDELNNNLERIFKSLIKYDNIKDYYEKLVNRIKNNNDTLNVMNKIYINKEQLQDKHIIYKLSHELWESAVINQLAPYELDGLIFTPVNENYISNILKTNKTIYREYKWKPINLVSIDFYIKFERDRKTNKIIEIFDNTINDDINNKDIVYYKCYLHVGSKKTKYNESKPVKFMENINYDHCYLKVKDNAVHDIEGNVLHDDTVVEFAYDVNLPDYYRWIPLRMRHDKTYDTRFYNKRYGNFETVAYNTWKIIQSPLTIDDFKLLGNLKTYTSYKNKIQSELMSLEYEETKYYTTNTDLALKMRKFHNWIKSNLINIYASPYVNGKRKDLLDVAIGQGGDINKFFFADVNLAVCVDLISNNLFKKRGAIDRYNTLKHKFSNKNHIPQMYFIQADVTYKYELQSQKKAITNLLSTHEKLIKEKLNNVKYDVINCQMALHYFLKTKTSLDNFLYNVNNLLKDNGYLLITCLDAEQVFNQLKDKNIYTINYINENGNKNVLFEITKQYVNDKLDSIQTGVAVNIENNIIPENRLTREYLVYKKFLINYIKNKYNIICEDTMLFSDLYKLHNLTFKNLVNNVKDKNSLKHITKLYDFFTSKENIDIESKKMMSLYRFYVFKKVKNIQLKDKITL